MELKAEGYQVVDDGLFAGYRNTEIQKDDIKIQLACAPVDMDDFDEKAKSEEEFSLDAVECMLKMSMKTESYKKLP